MKHILNILDRLIDEIDQFLLLFEKVIMDKEITNEIKKSRSKLDNDRELIKTCETPQNLLEFRKTMYCIYFINEYIQNVLVFEQKVVSEYDSLNKYITFDKLFSDKKMTKDSKNRALLNNVRVVNSMPTQVLTEVTLIPDVSLTLEVISQENIKDGYEIIKRFKNMYGYSHTSLKLLNKLFKEYFSQFIEQPDQDKIYDEVRGQISSLGSNGLNLALDEVISELNSGEECTLQDIVVDGTNTITSGKVMTMAQKVANKLSTKIESGDVDVDELVGASKNFINGIINSDMFKNHPDSKQVQGMFEELMGTVTTLADAYNENKESEDIDNILGDLEK